MNDLELAILRILSDAAPHMVREKTLYNETVVEAERTTPTRHDFDRALQRLQNKEGGAQVIGIGGEDMPKWKITAEGLARLASL